MIAVADLPLVNAVLNSTSAVLLTLGFASIRTNRVALHRGFMCGAFATSTVFLVSYLTYHFLAGSTPYAGVGWMRTLYFSILLSHTVLAAAVPPLAVVTIYLALRGRFTAHKRLARWTWPVWMYVSVTGVVIYLMLYPVGGSVG